MRGRKIPFEVQINVSVHITVMWYQMFVLQVEVTLVVPFGADSDVCEAN